MNRYKNLKMTECLGDFASLSDAQYLACRDAGYLPEELIGATYAWYQANHENIKYNDALLPAMKKQLALIATFQDCTSTENITFALARNLIRNAEILLNQDARYIELATVELKKAAQQKTNKAIKRKEKEAKRKLEGGKTPQVALTTSFNNDYTSDEPFALSGGTDDDFSFTKKLETNNDEELKEERLLEGLGSELLQLLGKK